MSIIGLYLLGFLYYTTYSNHGTAEAQRPSSGGVWIWNKGTRNFVSLEGQTYKDYRPTFRKNESIYSTLKGVTIHVVSHNMDPYIINRQNSSRISGFLGDMWNIMEDLLEFKSNITPIENFEDGREMIKEYKADIYLAALVYTKKTTNMYFSQPYFSNWYYLYIRLPYARPSNYLHYESFSGQLWVTVLVFFLFLTMVLWLTCIVLRKLGPENEVLLSLPTYFLGVISGFCDTGYDLRLRSCSAKLQIFLAMFFGALCYYAFSARLVATLAVVDVKWPFNTLMEVYSQNTYALCMRNISFVYDNFTDDEGVLLPKWQEVVNNEKCPRDMVEWTTIPDAICQGNVAILENRIIMGLVLTRVKCEVTFLMEKYFPTGNYIAVSKKFKKWDALAVMMTRIRSSGIAQKLEKKWVKSEVPTYTSPTSGNQITFYHVKGVIVIYAILIGTSLLILILEICCQKVYGIILLRNEEKIIQKYKNQNTKFKIVTQQGNVWYYE